MIVREAQPEDAPQIALIYNRYVAESIATFEVEPIATSEMLRRMNALGDRYPFLVAVEDEQVVGYAYAHEFRQRPAYSDTTEISIYLDPTFAGHGIGSALYADLFPRLQTYEFHAVIAGIALPNEPSVRLHEKVGMRKVAHFEEVGTKFGHRVDVGYWQLLFTHN